MKLLSHKKESGAVFVLSAIVLLGLILLVFGTIQYLNAVSAALRNYRTVQQIVQVMKANTPSEAAAYQAAAWALKLNGYDDATVASYQEVGPGNSVNVSLGYNGNVVPHQVAARIQITKLPLLAGFMKGVLGQLGLTNLSTDAQLSGSSYDSFVSVHLDNSESMRGPRMPDRTPTTLSRLINEADTNDADGDAEVLREAPPGTPANGSFCWPLDMSAAGGDPVAQRRLCMKLRAKLPFYTYERAEPIWHRYDLPRPGPILRLGYSGAYDPNNPADYETVPPGHYMAGSLYDPYNPGIDYSNPANRPPGDNLLICGDPRVGTFTPPWAINGDSCRQDDPLRPCFPIASGTQFRRPSGIPGLNEPGFRLEDYLTNNCEFGSPAGGCSRSAVERITDNDWCVGPWTINRNWLTEDEDLACPRPPVGNELPVPGCRSQIGSLTYQYSDFYRTYKEYAQAFLITISEVAPLVNLSVFAGPVNSGTIGNLVCGQPYRFGGNRLLFDAIANRSAGLTGHLFIDEVDNTLDDITNGYQVVKDDGTCGGIPGTLPYVPGGRKQVGLIPHLDPRTHPYMDSLSSWDPDFKEDAYRLFQALSPLDHPTRSAINNTTAYAPYPPPPRRGGSWELSNTNDHPAYWHSSNPYTPDSSGDIRGSGDPRRFFPDSRTMGMPAPLLQVLNNLWFLPLDMNPGWRFNKDLANPALYDWGPLKSINTLTGEQLATPYQPEDVKTFASHVFNDLVPMTGGTDLEDVFRQGRTSCLTAKGNDPLSPLPCVLFVVTDGLPNLPCTSQGLPPGTSCYGGSGMSIDEHLTKIGDQLREYRSYKNTFTIMLFMANDGTVFTNPNYGRFKNLFQSDPVSSFFMEFEFTDTTTFQTQFEQSLKIVKALIQTYLKLISN